MATATTRELQVLVRRDARCSPDGLRLFGWVSYMVALRHALVGLVFVISGCQVWASRSLHEIGVVGRSVRVFTDDGRRRSVLEGATAAGDSVVGRLTQTDTLRAGGWVLLRPGHGERTVIRAAAINRIEAYERETRWIYAPLIVLGAVVLAGLLLGSMLPDN